jgi:hypothetical protein
MPTDYLEDDYRSPYETWQADQTPEGNATMLKAIDPIIQKGISAHVGKSSPLVASRARKIALDGVRGYDPARSRLQTHLMNRLQSLKRAQRQMSQVVSAPERILLDRAKLEEYTQEMEDEMGREPTDAEIANRTGFAPRRLKHIRGYRHAVAEGRLDAIDPGLAPGMAPDPKAQQAWVEMIYDELPPMDQKILEYSLGLHGRKRLSNQEIALKLKRSPGAITQRKQRIQVMLDQEQDISPFLE